MLSRILSWFATGGISAIGEQINEWERIRAAAENDERRVEADKQIAQLEARREVLIAEQRRWYTAWIRPAIAAPVVIFIWKILVFDTVLGLGTTDNPGSLVMWIVNIVVASYFLTRPFERR